MFLYCGFYDHVQLLFVCFNHIKKMIFFNFAFV